ncbi:MAG TPA: ribosomal protein S18-alanine N-acetyltransferase [Solirubrobacteraceae bacterium]|nr:ribosomal protein S18-alanine N-acetyltransferase [Solirubrobacteraceae bacterium]
MTTEPATTIRSLRYSDLPQVIAIERRAFPTPWSLAMFVLELSKPSGICLAVTEEPDDSRAARLSEAGSRAGGNRERIVGYLVCSRYDQAWHLMNIAVDPGARRRGLGSALLAAMIERAGENAAYTLEVRTSNAGAIALYERFGFRAAGTRRRYYTDAGEDAMIMWRADESHWDAGAA